MEGSKKCIYSGLNHRATKTAIWGWSQISRFRQGPGDTDACWSLRSADGLNNHLSTDIFTTTRGRPPATSVISRDKNRACLNFSCVEVGGPSRSDIVLYTVFQGQRPGQADGFLGLQGKRSQIMKSKPSDQECQWWVGSRSTRSFLKFKGQVWGQTKTIVPTRISRTFLQRSLGILMLIFIDASQVRRPG